MGVSELSSYDGCRAFVTLEAKELLCCFYNLFFTRLLEI